MKKSAFFILIAVVISLFLIIKFKYTAVPKVTITNYGGLGKPVWAGVNFPEWFEGFKRNIAILGNDGGMRIAHQFAMYTILRIIRPTCVIESGIYKGVTTQIIRKTLPEALIISLDPLCNSVNFSVKHDIYCGTKFTDFKDMGAKWNSIDKRKAIVVFDDHQSGFLRLLQSKQFGFKYVVIEDNYPFKDGDNYSPKQVFTDADGDVEFQDNFGRIKKRISKEQHYINRQILKDAINLYAEFPPLHKNMTVDYLSKTFLNHNSAAELYRMMVDGLDLIVPFEREYLLYHFIALIELKQ